MAAGAFGVKQKLLLLALNSVTKFLHIYMILTPIKVYWFTSKGNIEYDKSIHLFLATLQDLLLHPLNVKTFYIATIKLGWYLLSTSYRNVLVLGQIFYPQESRFHVFCNHVILWTYAKARIELNFVNYKLNLLMYKTYKWVPQFVFLILNKSPQLSWKTIWLTPMRIGMAWELQLIWTLGLLEWINATNSRVSIYVD